MSPGARKLFDLRPGACRWPHGDPAVDSFRWCGARAVDGRPYCAKHLARAYDANMSDTPTDMFDDGPRRLLVRDRTAGARRRWVERVPNGNSAPARRGVASVSPEPPPAVALGADARHAPPLRLHRPRPAP
jgi:hypothetical protein